LAPAAGAFFDNETIIPFMRVLAIATFVIGFENIGVILLQKEMRFNRYFLLNVSIVILELISVIIAVFFFRNAWALVFGAVSNRIFAVILSYAFHPYRPKFKWNQTHIRHLFSYGRWVWVMSFIGYLVSQGDNLTIGKMLTPADLGLYQPAFALALLPAGEIARVFGNILFPLFSKIQGDKEILKRSFIRVARIIFAVTIPASFGLLALAPEIVSNIYGERWLGMVPILSVLIFYGLIKSFEFVVNPLFLGVGKPKTSAASLFSQFAVMFILIVPLTAKFGAPGAAFAVLSGSIAAQSIFLFAIRREIGFGFRNLAEIVWISSVSAFLMYAAIVGTKSIFPIFSASGLFFFVLYGMGVYAIALFVLDFLFGKNMYNSLLWIKKNL
jgi:O-antigen/teichoic acid export membrane protein